MSRGMLLFSLIFLVLPLVVFLAVWAAGLGLGLTFLALALLVTGFAIGLPMFSRDAV